METFKYDGLIANAKHPVDVKSVKLTFASQGFEEVTLTRGTLLCLDANGKAIKFTAAEGQSPDSILTDDITVTAAGDYVATAYKTGCFARQVINTATGITLTDAQVETLRTKGIFIETVMQ